MRRTALMGLAGATCLAVADPGLAVSEKRAGRTYGITSKTSKSGRTKTVAIQRPKRLVYRTNFDYVKVTGIGAFDAWGEDGATASARKVRMCTIEGRKKVDCTAMPGTVTFDFLSSRKCRVKKGKKARKVGLYGRLNMDQTDGKGIAAQYSYPGEKPDCPDRF